MQQIVTGHVPRVRCCLRHQRWGAEYHRVGSCLKEMAGWWQEKVSKQSAEAETAGLRGAVQIIEIR